MNIILQKHDEPEQLWDSTRLLPDSGNESEAKVLIIDDDRTMRRMACKLLQDYCHVYEAPDASQGLSSYNKYRPDIVFMDIELPDGNGHDLLSWILQRDPSAFVVMFSGHNFSKNIIKAAEMGAKGFISKPFSADRMLYYIQKYPRFH